VTLLTLIIDCNAREYRLKATKKKGERKGEREKEKDRQKKTREKSEIPAVHAELIVNAMMMMMMMVMMMMMNFSTVTS
jgi:hypothetical protein